jgi:carbonic anhydrase
MEELADYGQKPEVMVVACCDSRVDPAHIVQCHPGDLFVVRNVANIVPPYEQDDAIHGVSAALEFGIRFLQVKHLILLGHSQCGGIQALTHSPAIAQNDFISRWVSLIGECRADAQTVDECAQSALHHSYRNCLSFPWIKERMHQGDLEIHRWFFDIKSGQVFNYHQLEDRYVPLDEDIV